MLLPILGVGLVCFFGGIYWEKLTWVAACRKTKIMAYDGKLYRVYEVQAKKPEED